MVPFKMIFSLSASISGAPETVRLFCTSPQNPRPSKAGVKRAATPHWHSPHNCKHRLKEALASHLAYGVTFLISDVVSDFSLFD